MPLLLNILEIVCVVLGASASFIFDCFFMVSVKKHRITPYEEKTLSRLNLMAVICSFTALFVYILSVSYFFESDTLGAVANSQAYLSFITAKIAILALAFVCGLTLRKIHLPTLLRYQRQYFHLSEHMVEHQYSLVSTAMYSSAAWLMILALTAVEQNQDVTSLHVGFLAIFGTYIVAGYVFSRAGWVIKSVLS